MLIADAHAFWIIASAGAMESPGHEEEIAAAKCNLLAERVSAGTFVALPDYSKEDRMAGKIFISYRRDDGKEAAIALRNYLVSKLKTVTVFIDVENTIPPGENFERIIRQRIAESDLVLVVIGDRWLSLTANGQRRIEAKGDLVILEVYESLRLGVKVVPVLLNDVKMPVVDSVPREIAFLLDRNASRLRLERFNADADGIAKVVRDHLRRLYPTRSAAKLLTTLSLGCFVSGIAGGLMLHRMNTFESDGRSASSNELALAQNEIRRLRELVTRLEGLSKNEVPRSRTSAPEQLADTAAAGTEIIVLGAGLDITDCTAACLQDSRCVVVSHDRVGRCFLYSDVKGTIPLRGTTTLRGFPGRR